MCNSWGRALRRFFCWPGAEVGDTYNNEPIYESVEELHQAQSTASALQVVVVSVDEIRRLLALIADVQERMRRLELNLHPLLVYRPEDGEYMTMLNGSRPAPAVPLQEPPAPNVWQRWLQERVDLGEPW